MKNLFRSFGILAVSAMALASCSNKGGEASSATGWKYNDAEWGGFEKKQYEGQIDGPKSGNTIILQEG